MSTALSTLERAFHPAAAAIAALVGAVAGGVVFVSLSGAVLGLMTTLGGLGIAAVVMALLGWPIGTSRETRREPAAAPAMGALASSSSAVSAGEATETNETEAKILEAGRFAEYHLAKAKRMLAARDYKNAAYQAGASLAHDDLAEARQVLAEARAAIKS